jgi:hypothetical protein
MSSLPTAIQGALRPSLLLSWRRQGTGAPEDLTGATLSGSIINSQSGVAHAIAGQLVLVDGPGGQFRWDFAHADVATPGSYAVEFVASFAAGQTPAKTFTAGWLVVGSPSP